MPPNERDRGGTEQWKGADIDHSQTSDTGSRVSRSERGEATSPDQIPIRRVQKPTSVSPVALKPR